MSIKRYGEEIYAGLETAWSLVADFFISPGKYLQVRKLMVRDQGNPGQIIIGRAGPDGADPTKGFTKPVGVEPTQNVGHIAWIAYQDEGFGERLAQIHCRFQGNNRGSLHFSTSGQERVAITEDGFLDLTGLQSEAGGIKVMVDGKKGILPIQWTE